MKPILTPRELAEAIGVSESSIKRWTDDGAIRGTRTAGGHRRIPISEALRFIRESRSILVRPEILGLADVAALGGEVPAFGEEGEQLFAYLKAGAAVEARGLLISLYLGGRSVAQVLDGPMREAMHRLGELWQCEEAGIFHEHRATDIAIHALNQLRTLLPGRPEGALGAVGGAPSGDPYVIPTLGVAATLEAEGFAAVNLGPETPGPTLQQAVRRLSPAIVWVSVSVAGAPGALAAELWRLADGAVGEEGPTLVVGGRRVHELDLPSHPRLLVGASMGELVAFARGLKASLGQAG